MGTPRQPRTPRGNNGSSINLEVGVERTIGSVGGIRTDAEATVGIDAFLRNNKASGYIDPDNRAGGLSAGIGSSRRGLGGEVGVDAQFNEDGSINSIGGNIAGSVLGFGAGVRLSSAGDAKISGQAFGIGVEVARDEKGNITLQTCFSIGIIEACTTFSRDKGDPQNTEGTIKGPVIGFGAGNKPPRPRIPNASKPSPNDTNKRDSRKKSQPKASQNDKPKPNPRPKPDKPDKPKTGKKPQLDPKKKPVGFGKKPVVTPPKKRPLEPTKKKPINLGKKKPINLGKKKPINLGKKKPIDPSPINLGKPKAPSPAPKAPRPSPSPSPTTPKLPKPSPAPKAPLAPKPPRPNPWPRDTPTPTPSPKQTKNGFESENPGNWPILNTNCNYGIFFLFIPYTTLLVNCIGTDPGSGHGYYFEMATRGRLSKADYSGLRWDTNFRRWFPQLVEEQEEGRIKVSFSAALVRYTEGDKIIKGLGYFNGDGLELGGSILFLPEAFGSNVYMTGKGPNQQTIQQIMNAWANPIYYPNHKIIFQLIEFCPDSNADTLPIAPPSPTPSPTPKFKSPRLPNKPTKIKPMDCCKEIKDIYKYLGIAKMKKDKFKVAKAFMVAGGKGNEVCKDYYAVTQALFRMLANGLIINPISSPLGNEWQNVNATTWAAQVYEMIAESMSNGNSSQKFEIGAIMQLAQIMSTLAETARKTEYIIDAIGYDPILDSEDVPIVFTIHESHKGFDPKAKVQKIDITKAKTDDDVEAILAKMLVPSKIPIVSWRFNPNNISISKALRGL